MLPISDSTSRVGTSRTGLPWQILGSKIKVLGFAVWSFGFRVEGVLGFGI